MHRLYCAALFALAAAVAGCTTFQVAGQVQSGRRALLMNDPEAALGYLQQAAQTDPNYIYSAENFRESVWTYLGRSHYALGRWDEARRSFERALSVYRDDAMAQLYLGLAMVRSGERAQGLNYIQMGLKGLYDWIEHLNRIRAYPYWDPSASIRKEIDKTLAMISGEPTESMNTLMESADWIGRQMEEEIDKVRMDERRDFRDLDRGPGSGFGFGFGF